ncbi:sensor histidine kinase YkoH [Bacillus sp. J14TS2]|uniref:sensor histidine kinase n=1 Tax=Bacillus sp. J14TS2 TaxID=2807188 RepID=UPI001B033A92|nr:HAMP domain-containing sensor histidine kinase [Bacillus sp. J14TS2]GIN70155.1 sensor histidine kinase YkoH [Bacillus sp. J14TS2]
MKLRSKINLYTSVLIIFLLVLINSSIYFTFNHFILKNELEKATFQALNIVREMEQTESSRTTQHVLRAYVPVDSMIRVVKQDGTSETATTAKQQEQLIDLPITFVGKERHQIVKNNEIVYAFVSIPIIWEPTGEVVEFQLTENLSSSVQILSTLKWVLIIITILAAIPVILSSRLLGNFITRPITNLIRTMNEIRDSDQYKRIDLPKTSNDELYQMGKTFNEMILQLEKNYEKQEAFVSNASHELKTPLTIIESYANLLKRRGKEREEIFDESVEAIHSEAIRMKELTQQLLLLAKNDTQWKVEITHIALDEVIKESVQSFRTTFQRNIILQIEQPIVVQSDLQKLKQLLYILMDNALKYSEGSIEVKVGNSKEYGWVEISDHGIGIPAEELSKIFDRFYRVDKARTRKSGGFGLGLPLAKEMANAINATLNVKSIEGQGTSVRIFLPVASSN